jgi:hydrogenase 3 maturation protease
VCGDDGFGPAFVEALRDRVDAILIDAEDVPENYLVVIERAEPEVVVLVDAVQMNAAPGATAILELDCICGLGLTTHNAGLPLFARLLKAMTSADVFVLAVQPETTTFGAPLSPLVWESLCATKAILEQALGPIKTTDHKEDILVTSIRGKQA